MAQRWRILAALVAVLALSGLTAGQAAAAETLSFVPQSNKFPLKASVKGNFMTFYEASEAYGCETVGGELEVTGHKTAKIKLVLKGCNTPTGAHCQSEGAASGEIKTASLPVELVYTNKEHHEAGLDINYAEAGKTAGQLAAWGCKGILGGETKGLGIRGSLIAPATAVNVQAATHTLTLSHVAKSETQSPRSYETEAGKLYAAFPELALVASEDYLEGSVTDEKIEVTSIAGEGNLEIKA
jgi:hypothetical protein